MRRLTLALLLVPAVAAAHGNASDVRALVSTLPPPLAGMRVEVHDTIAPQLVLANPTARVVEVLDERGVAFVRIGPRDVDANLGAPAWYRTQGPGAPVPDTARADAEPRWTRVRAEASYGWFDPRLDPGDLHQHSVTHASEPVTIGLWEVPLRVDGQLVALTGTFVRMPRPAGAYAARLTSSSELAPGVRVRLLPGRQPGLLVENVGARTVTVLGADGEPFLRVGPAGVDANARSTTWQRSGRATVVDATPAREPAWVRVGTGTRYGWIDPRLAAPAGFGEAHEWRVPLLIGTEPAVVTGELAWRAE